MSSSPTRPRPTRRTGLPSTRATSSRTRRTAPRCARGAARYGALRALETLSQAVIFGAFGSDGYFLPSPFKVRDAPRFAHRGLLVDAARHFLPPRLLERTVDAMSYTKLNVLHLHLSDHESFPLRLPGFPSLKPWSWREAYTVDDMARLVEYGRLRGVAVMAEAGSPIAPVPHDHSYFSRVPQEGAVPGVGVSMLRAGGDSLQ